MEKDELNAKVQINSLSNEIKLKSEKIRELESKIGNVRDKESNLTLKELQDQNSELKRKLTIELKKFEELQSEYNNMEETYNLANDKFKKLREMKFESIENFEYVKGESQKVIDE